MLQAFISLKHQQPPRTESGMQSFFEALSAASYSSPTYFCTNVDATAKAYSVESITQACLHEKCKFAVIRGGDPYWQATVLMPDKKGQSALFVELEDGVSVPTVEQITTWARNVYEKVEPRLIRIGDSEAREKLKSRHGLVLMPGLGRVEWLQVVHPDVYGELYNPSELVAAPAYAAEIWEDGALFLRVYGDPKDWENEENISLANFIPGFLAGTANVKDGEKEKQNVRTIEKLWNRSSKTAERAAQTFKPPTGDAKPAPAPEAEPEAVVEAVEDEAPTEVVTQEQIAAAHEAAEASKKPEAVEEGAEVEAEPVEEVAEVEAEPVEELAEVDLVEEVAEVEAEPVEEVAEVEPEAVEDEKPAADGPPPSADDVASLIATQLTDIKLESGTINALNAKGFDQAIYSGLDASSSPPSKFFVGWDAAESKLRALDKLEDFAAFLQNEGLSVQESDKDKIVAAATTYHRCYLSYISSITEIPQPAAADPRLADFKAQVKAPFFDVSDETQQLHIWAYNPRSTSLEEVLIRQFEDWPLTMEVKRHLLDLKAPKKEAEKKAEPAEEKKAAEEAEKKAATAAEDKKGKRQMMMLFVLLLILAAAAAVYVFYFDADYTKLWTY